MNDESAGVSSLSQVVSLAARSWGRRTPGDLMMPAMTGMELFDRLVEVAPDQASRVIFLSGGAFTPQAREFLGRVKNARMDKPFETQALRELVRRRIESH